MKNILIANDPVLSEISVTIKAYEMPLYTDLLAVWPGGDTKYGAFKGSLLACWRILRCNPFPRVVMIPFRKRVGKIKNRKLNTKNCCINVR